MSEQQTQTQTADAAPAPVEKKPRKPRPPRTPEQIEESRLKRLAYLNEKQKTRMQKRLTDLEAHKALLASIKRLIAEFEEVHGPSAFSAAVPSDDHSPVSSE